MVGGCSSPLSPYLDTPLLPTNQLIVSQNKCGKNVFSYLRVGIHLEHQNTCTKRMKSAGISASVAGSSVACRGETNFECNYTHALPFLDNHSRIVFYLSFLTSMYSYIGLTSMKVLLLNTIGNILVAHSGIRECFN